MELWNLKPKKGSRKRRIRVGRGESSGVGKTCGKGGKGQTARTGGGVRAGFEGGQMPLYRRVPKFGFTSQQRVFGTNQYVVVNLSDLEKFEGGATIDIAAFETRGFKEKLSKQAGIKVLGSGSLTKKLHVKAHAISETAKAAIEKVGGTVEIISKAHVAEAKVKAPASKSK